MMKGCKKKRQAFPSSILRRVVTFTTPYHAPAVFKEITLKYGIANKWNKFKIIFGGQIKRSSILLCVAPGPTTAQNHV